MTTQSGKFGIFDFGFIENNRTFIDELNAMIKPDTTKAEFRPFNIAFYNAFKKGELKYLDKFGNSIAESDSIYALYETGFKDKNDNEIIAYFYRYKSEKNWSGIYFSTETELKKEIKRNLLFRIGSVN